jgi:hypothetical protein
MSSSREGLEDLNSDVTKFIKKGYLSCQYLRLGFRITGYSSTVVMFHSKER